MLENAVDWLKHRSKASLTAAGLILVILVGVADSLTPRAMVFAIFYLPAIFLVTWFAGKRAGILVACCSAIAWLVVNRAQAAPGTPVFIPYWNALSGLVVFLAVVFLLSAVKALNVGLEDKVTQRTAELKRLEKEVLEISDQEQRRIGQDLHDGLCQHLTATMFASKILQEELARQSPPHAAQAGQIAAFINQAIGQTRDVARGLDPVKVATNGLMSALEELATMVRDLHRIDCSFHSAAPVLIDDNAAAIHLYRIAQEAVNNAVKHAAPKRIDIGLADADGKIVLTIQNDGKGLSAGPDRRGGMGLQTMNYRARMIGAALDVKPGPAGGTIVTCALSKNVAVKPGRETPERIL